MRELKRFAGTCEFTNEQLSDGLRDYFICGLRSEQIKRKLLSANFSFQEAVDADIAQEIAQKDVRDLGARLQGENSSSSVHKVKRDKGWSRGRSFGRHQGENRKQPQQAGIQKKRCFRYGLTNHSPGDCTYKGSECFKCYLTGHLQSECQKGRSLSKKFAGKQHVRHTDQYSEEGGSGTLERNFSCPFLAWRRAKNVSHASRDLPHPQ